MFKQYMIRGSMLCATALSVLISTPSHAVDLNLSPVPLFLSPGVAPLNMLVVGRDHKLYYEAYNDASDLNGDGKIDFGYKGYLTTRSPTNPTAQGLDYYGYFDSFKCYTYAGNLFTPVRETTTKICGGASEWSGDFLNYMTMSRIDALRKVLYGGKRDVDTSSQTVLIRSHIPMDAHSWGKEYQSVAHDGYNIRNYTPYDVPTSGRHLFANTTPNVDDASWVDNINDAPLFRVLQNSPYRIWEWVSKESPVAGTRVSPTSGDVTVTPTDMVVRVEACPSARIGQENCKRYTDGNYKPIGLLHEFGENDSMKFGLLTGSYTANKSGGVLRKNIGSITDEIDPDDGTLTNVTGIIKTLDAFRVAAYTRYTGNGGTNYDCGLPEMARGAPADGTCRMWGNPVAEMMYETLRYFRGMSPTPAFTRTYGGDNQTVETTLGLPRPGWEDPYASPLPNCAKPFETVMADVNNSYDSDQLPGSLFAVETGSDAISDVLPNLDVGALAGTITGYESGFPGLRFIGQSGATYDGAPTPKTVTSLANIRGLAPEEPTKQGSYYAASVAYHGISTELNSATTGNRTDEKVQTFAVALASPLPKIEIPIGTGTNRRVVTLVPFAKSVDYGTEIDRDEGDFQPTNQIVDFYVEDLADDQTSGTFQVNFEDVEAGNDHDMDAIARYSYRVVGSTVQVDVSSDYQAGGIIHHIGYVISGTTADGVYLVVQDCNKTGTGTYNCNGSDPDYFLDTPTGEGPGGDWDDDAALPGFSSRTFSPATTGNAATLLKDPLWYAAKWGGFKDTDRNNRPNLPAEWDSNGNGDPDNYFLVTNALTLTQQLRAAFTEILGRASTASSAAVNSGSISTDTRIYQARFDTNNWTGDLYSFRVDERTGVLDTNPLWQASGTGKIPGAAVRNIITVNSNDAAVPFEWTPTGIDATRRAQLDAAAGTAEAILNYLRGDRSLEESRAPSNSAIQLRNRTSVLGDIVGSAPMYVGAPRARYSDSLESEPYSAFVTAQRNRNAMVYVGANDGMLHGFDAGGVTGPDPDGAGPNLPPEDNNGGREVFAFIPKTVFGNLSELSRPTYSHRYFVDGAANSNDVFINGQWRTVLIGGLNSGGQGIYALDVTNPGSLGTSSFLWEINDRTVGAGGTQPFRDLGYTFSQPAIVRLHDGTWAAVFGNGYNNTVADGAASATGNAVLYIVDIETGALLKKFDTFAGLDDAVSGDRPNGMATPTMVDVDGDRIVDHAYVGDLYGNLWKIDLRSTNPDEWGFAFGTAANPQPLFIANDGATPTANRQPITARVEVARGPFGAGAMVLFGTGKFLEPNDRLTTERRVQSFYGLVDRNTYTSSDQITARSQLQAQTITAEFTLPNSTQRGRRTSAFGTMGSGWYLDLKVPVDTYEGERVVTDPIIRDDRVIFTTLIPTAVRYPNCDAGGRSWLMVLDLLSGGQLTQSQLDTNGDNQITSADQNVSGVSADEAGGILSRPAGLRCLGAGCLEDRLISSSTVDGSMDQRALKSIGGARGRQSWRQIR